MKLIVFFLAGMVVSLLIVFAIFHVGSPVQADDSVPGGDSVDLASMLPDIQGNYHTCLTEPFKQAETEIHDPDIANYYHKLMQKTGLTEDNDP
jgi:hypothetical protein